MTSGFKKISKNEIKICYWNIHGTKSPLIKNKLLDPEFIRKLKDSDIVSLTELHSEDKDLFIPGYTLKKVKIRKKTHKGPKISGGIAVFVKENLSDSVHVVPNTNENSIWVKMKKKSTADENLFVGSFYISPENKKNKIKLFDLLNDEVKKIGNKGDIVLQGDFNARTGVKNDFIQPDTFLDNLFENSGSSVDFSKFLPPRNSEDKQTNPRGEELLDFCKTNEFSIVNGRKIGDLFGKCTSQQHNGSSAIDYVITPITGFDKISYFEVGDYIPWLSDHTPIYSDVRIDIDKNPPEPPITLHGRDQGYLWDDECEENFKAFLSNEREKLEKVNQSVRNNSDANKLADEIKNSLLEASKNCKLKKKKHRKNEATNPWFDKECLDLKKCVTKIGRKLQSNPGDKELRSELFEKKKKLKKMVRNKKRLHKRTILKEMEQCTNNEQKKYWRLVKKLEQKDQKTTQYVSPRNLLKHYKNLLCD